MHVWKKTEDTSLYVELSLSFWMQESEEREEFPTFYPYKSFLYAAHSLRALGVR